MKGKETKKEKRKTKADPATVKVASDYQKGKTSKQEVGTNLFSKK